MSAAVTGPGAGQQASTGETVRVERLLLVERLRGLPAPHWDAPSLCEGWSVRLVVAHLVTPFAVSPMAMALAVARRRSIGRAMDDAARQLAAGRTPAELLRVLEENAASRFRPPGLPLAAPLADVVAHSADIRWALGDPLDDWSSATRLRPALDFLTGPRAAAGFVPPRRLRGVALVADDQDWTWGSGDVVRGPSLALLMAVLGRSAARPALGGDGVDRLLARSG